MPTPSENQISSQKSAEARFAQAMAYVQRQVKRALKRTAERWELYKKHLEECTNWNRVHHQAELLQANLFRMRKGMRTLSVSDWEKEGEEVTIELDPLMEPADQVSALFRRSRKLRKGEPHLLKQTVQVEAALRKVEEQLQEMAEISSMEQLEQFCKQHRYEIEKKAAVTAKKIEAPRLPYDRYLSAAGMEIWVGKSAKDNDLLTFHHAHGSDYWLHVRDHPGSHVVLRCINQETPDQESLHDAAELALRFSKCKDDSEVSITQVKFVKKVKGIPGRAMLSKHRTIFWKMHPGRWERLKQSKVK